MRFVGRAILGAVLLISALPVLLGCTAAPPEPKKHAATADQAEPSPPAAPSIVLEIGDAPAEQPGLHNVMRLTGEIYSGGEPEGDAGFATLAGMGVRTVVSVDGGKPDIAAARKHGLRYVHIPIGYDGVEKIAGAALARLVDEIEGPLYIHCHHGKHRGPAAAAVACVARGAMNNEQAVEILERAGTSGKYAGLWRDVQSYARPPAGAELPPLVETAEVGTLAAAMSQLDRGFDRLKLCRDVNWTVPEDHPDIVPAQEALLVREALHEAGRNLAGDFDDTFKAWLAESEQLAAELEKGLAAGRATEATAALGRLEQACQQCHARYRDR
jgi:protein tyrosine phosphatase (PTP) superfamily phosphohydrolase (DUF442 family)